MIPNLIAIAVAFLAGFIALFQVKSNIISTARISWNEKLRDSISKYSVTVLDCATIIVNMRDDCKGKTGKEISDTIKEHYPDYFSHSKKAQHLKNKILLYLNSNEKDHALIEELLKKINFMLEKTDLMLVDPNQIEIEVDKVISASKHIFKKEWQKAKKIYRV